MNLKEAFDFVATIRTTWKTSKGTWRAPFVYNRHHALRLLGDRESVRRITKSDLAHMRAKLMQERGKKGLRTPGGVNRIMSMTHTLLKELADNDIIDKAPRLTPLKETGERKEWFSREDIAAMVKVSREEYRDNELGDAILFGVYTGCRQGELLDLRVGDVDLAKGYVTFRDTKNGEDHVLDIHPHIRNMLEMRVDGEHSSSLVFDFTNKDALYNAFKKVRDTCNISDRLVWHSLRHTTGTWLAEQGVPLQTIAKVLNHKNVSTSERYVKISDQARRAAVNAL